MYNVKGVHASSTTIFTRRSRAWDACRSFVFSARLAHLSSHAVRTSTVAGDFFLDY